MYAPIPVSVAYGDGTGPEIMETVLRLMRQAGANLAIESIEIGQRFYENGVPTGIPPYAWQSLERTRLLLKAPTHTPGDTDTISTTEALIRYFGPLRARRAAWQAHALPELDVPALHVASSHIGDGFAFFEPAHDIAASHESGVTPGMLQAASMLLDHIGQAEAAEKLREF